MKTVIDIERLLIWTYQDQAADAVVQKVTRGIYPAPPQSQMAILERQAVLGVRVDHAGPGTVSSNDLHPDAEAVHDAVLLMPPTEIGLVISHAKGGTRPDWMPDAKPRALPVLRSNGRPKMEWDIHGKRPTHCLIRYAPDPAHVEFMRRVYGIWWAALDDLVDALADLSDHHVTGPRIERAPWK